MYKYEWVLREKYTWECESVIESRLNSQGCKPLSDCKGPQISNIWPTRCCKSLFCFRLYICWLGLYVLVVLVNFWNWELNYTHLNWMCYEFRDNWMNYILYGIDSSICIIDVNCAKLGMNKLWIIIVNVLVYGPMIKVDILYE